jgi:hypothetical protein
LLVIGAPDTISVVVRRSPAKVHTPDDMGGRVFAVNSLFTATSNQFGTFRAGMAVALSGTLAAVLIGGLSTMAGVLISAGVFCGCGRPKATCRANRARKLKCESATPGTTNMPSYLCLNGLIV